MLLNTNITAFSSSKYRTATALHWHRTATVLHRYPTATALHCNRTAKAPYLLHETPPLAHVLWHRHALRKMTKKGQINESQTARQSSRLRYTQERRGRQKILESENKQQMHGRAKKARPTIHANNARSCRPIRRHTATQTNTQTHKTTDADTGRHAHTHIHEVTHKQPRIRADTHPCRHADRHATRHTQPLRRIVQHTPFSLDHIPCNTEESTPPR